MKLILKAPIGPSSLVIHLIYFFVVAFVGITKTITYQQNVFINQNSATLLSSVSFGTIEVTNPFPFTFIGVTIMFNIILRFMYGVKKVA